MEQTLIQIAFTGGLIFLLYLKNIFLGTKEIVQHSTEFTKIIASIGKKKFTRKISEIKLKIKEELDYQEKRRQTILLIALEFNVSLDVAEGLFNEFEKMKM